MFIAQVLYKVISATHPRRTAHAHASTRFTAFGFLLLDSIYRHFNNFFAGRTAVFTQQNSSLVIQVSRSEIIFVACIPIYSYSLWRTFAMAALRYGGPEPFWATVSLARDDDLRHGYCQLIGRCCTVKQLYTVTIRMPFGRVSRTMVPNRHMCRIGCQI